MASASYPRAVATAALQAALGGAWIAAGELSPARRRLARAGTVAVVGAVAYAASPSSASSLSSASSSDALDSVGVRPFPVAEGRPAPPFDKRKAALAAGMIGLSVAALVGRRQLEKRWLARLTRNGHAHPTRALAVRMAGVEFAGQLALQLAERQKDRRKPADLGV